MIILLLRGDMEGSGRTVDASSLTNVKEIYSNNNAFVALELKHSQIISMGIL